VSFTPLPLRRALAASDGVAHVSTDDSVALLWLDIAGSTGIADSFAQDGAKGIEQLAALLTRHFDRLLGVIIAHGGEPMMFAGDALLSGWRSDPARPELAALRAAACGQAILDTPGISLPSNEKLQLHAILCFGPCRSIELGVGLDRLYTTVGGGLFDLQATAHKRAIGRLLLSASARSALAAAADVETREDGAVTLVQLHGAPPPSPLPLASLPPAAIERLRANVPLPIANRMVSGSLDWSAELRRVTVVFVAFPQLEPGDPEIKSKLDAIMAVAAPMVRRHDGFLEQLQISDAGVKLLILFGVPPVAHADDPARAVRLAADLRGELRGLGHRSNFGVATGEAFAGPIGNDTFRAWTELGMPLNRAARLAAVPGGGVNCDDATMRGARAGIEFAFQGQAQLRGVGPAIGVWTPRKYDLSEPRLPLHGRETELAALKGALHALASADPALNSGALHRLVTLEAESGMGKSRLLAEFEAQAAAEGVTVLKGKADRIESSVPYLGWRGVIAQLLDLQSGASVDAQRHALLAALPPDLAPRAALLNALLPIDLAESAETESLAPAQRASERQALLLTLLRNATAACPVLVTIDDAQWLDAASWSLVEAVNGESLRLLIVLAAHPLEDPARIKTLEDAGAHRISLGELSQAEQERLILSRVQAQRIMPDLLAVLHARTRGHPYYGLVLTQALLDEGAIEVVDGACRISANRQAAQLSLPDTIHGAVSRRIDRLDPDSQVTLKVGSVSGLRFPTALVVDIHPTAHAEFAHVQGHLMRHSSVDLLQAEPVDGMDGYAFRHGILRDVAYSLIPYSQRRRLHHEIVRWYEQVWADDPSRFFAVLAHHLEACEEPERAADYWRREAERVFGLGLIRESVEIGRHAARLLGAEIPADSDGLRQEIGREFGRIQKLLAGRRPDELTALPQLADARTGELMHLLLVVAPFAYQCGEMEVFALLSYIGFRLLLEHGNGPMGPDVVAMYSVVYGALTGDRETAAAWSRLSLTLLGDRRDAGFARCAFIQGWFHNHWLDSLSAGVALMEEGAEAGFSDNELIYGCFNLSGSVVLKAAAGENLSHIVDVIRRNEIRNDGRVANSAYTLLLELQFAKAMAGQTKGPLSLGDDEHDEERKVASIVDTNFTNQIGYFLVARTKLHVHAGDWPGATAWAEKALKMLPFFGGQSAEFELAQYRGLAALASVAFGVAADKQAQLDEGWDCMERLRGWETRNAALFRHKADLLEGLLQWTTGRPAGWEDLLARAAQGASEGKFHQDAGLAHEFLARIRLAAGDRPGAALAAASARESYRAWGADAKVAMMERLFGPLSS